MPGRRWPCACVENHDRKANTVKTSAKSLVLAPAVAAAITGLVAAPAFASPTSTSSATETTPAPSQSAAATPTASPSDGKDAPLEAQISVDQITRDDLANNKKGLEFTGTGFTPNETATVTVVDTTGKNQTPDTKIAINDKGELSGSYYFTVSGTPKDIPLGKYSLFLTDTATKKNSTKVEFEVVDKVTSSPSATPTESAKPSGSATPSTTVTTPAPTTAPSESPTQKPSPTETAAPSETATPTPTPTRSKPPTAKAEVPRASNSPTPTESGSSSPTESGSSSAAAAEKREAAASPKLSVDPKEISSENFTATKGGVTITVEDVSPGESVSLVVQHAQGKVKQYKTTKDADENGRAVFGVRGEGKPVLGRYNVTASAPSTDGLNGTFTVTTNDPNGGTGNGSGSGSGNSSASGSGNSTLPRTGADATGLALGAGLLVLGTAAIIVTRRRTKASGDPSDLG